MKKLQNVRDESTSYGELDESTDVTEIRKTVIAAHFGADSTRYNVRSHPHYEGNERRGFVDYYFSTVAIRIISFSTETVQVTATFVIPLENTKTGRLARGSKN